MHSWRHCLFLCGKERAKRERERKPREKREEMRIKLQGKWHYCPYKQTNEADRLLTQAETWARVPRNVWVWLKYINARLEFDLNILITGTCCYPCELHADKIETCRVGRRLSRRKVSRQKGVLPEQDLRNKAETQRMANKMREYNDGQMLAGRRKRCTLRSNRRTDRKRQKWPWRGNKG